jgi:Peptidase family S41
MKLIFIILTSFFCTTLFAQIDELYQSDLRQLKSSLEKTPSFKTQIKGQKLEDYKKLYDALQVDTSYRNSTFNYFKNLSRLFFPLRDNHLGFFQIAKFQNLTQIARINKNIDSLTKILSNKGSDSVEGIYNSEIGKIGVFKNEPNEYLGIIVDTEKKNLQKGDIVLFLYEQTPNYFKAVYTYGETNYYVLFQNEKYINRSLINKRLTKNYTQFETNVSANNKGEFELRNLTNEIQYLRIRNFSAEINKMKESQLFYDSIKKLLVAPNLILDLSINNGGAEKVSKKYLKLLNKYTKSNRLYVLVGNKTVSHGEIFTLHLKGKENTIILGQTTQGTLTYGINTDKNFTFSNGKIRAYFTDMNDNKKLLQYETIGVSPDRFLLMDKDWIEQVIEIIAKK